MLRFIGAPFPESLTLDQASDLIGHIIESDQYRERRRLWNRERLKLHPDLYATELADHWAWRCDYLHSRLNDEELRQYCKRVTKAQVRDVVAYLNQHFPNWDEDELGVAQVWDYALPAVHRLFPDRVKGYVADFPRAKAKTSMGMPSSGGCLIILTVLGVITFTCVVFITLG